MKSLLGAGAALALLIGAVACGGDGQATAENAEPYVRATRVETMVVTPRTFDQTIEVTGAIEAINDAQLSAQAAGNVDYIADDGDRVAAGEVVARLDQAAAKAAVGQAEAQVETAEAQQALALDNQQRLQPLKDRKAISEREFEQARLELQRAEASLRQAQAALATARVQLANTEVIAPFAGTVEQAFLEVGEHAGTGDPLVRLVSIDQVRVVAGVPERYVPDLHVGMPVQLRFPNVDIAPRSGQVTFVGSTIEATSRTFRIEVQVSNPARDLKPMILADVRVTRRQYSDVLSVPRIAIVTDELGPGVYIVERGAAGAVARRRPVTLGADAIGFVVVESGLDPGDEVIVLGQHSISDGDPVEVSGPAAPSATATSGQNTTG
ncbi:MAG: efflux RND transporter periplasmic adaptor subunit [Acidobacteriota bacterium]